jgi:hypothetical protein
LSANQTIGLATREKKNEDLALVDEGFDLFCHSKTTSAVGHVLCPCSHSGRINFALRWVTQINRKREHLTAIVTTWVIIQRYQGMDIGRLINRDHNDARKPGNQDPEIPAPTALEQVINANH